MICAVGAADRVPGRRKMMPNHNRPGEAPEVACTDDLGEGLRSCRPTIVASLSELLKLQCWARCTDCSRRQHATAGNQLLYTSRGTRNLLIIEDNLSCRNRSSSSHQWHGANSWQISQFRPVIASKWMAQHRPGHNTVWM